MINSNRLCIAKLIDAYSSSVKPRMALLSSRNQHRPLIARANDCNKYRMMVDAVKKQAPVENSQNEEGEDEFMELLGEDEDDGAQAEDVVTALGLGEDEFEPGIDTQGISWADAGLKAAQKVLSTPAMDGIDIYLFRAVGAIKKLDIRLDKLTDIYGSPSIEDIEKFSRMLNLELEAIMGVEAAGEISFEVSTPGAERQLQLPQDLHRFNKLPLTCDYTAADGQLMKQQILELLSFEEESGETVWGIADVRSNKTKGRSLSKKQREVRITIPVDRISKARIHVDF
jgi:ribosome maturation factor RimP